MIRTYELRQYRLDFGTCSSYKCWENWRIGYRLQQPYFQATFFHLQNACFRTWLRSPVGQRPKSQEPMLGISKIVLMTWKKSRFPSTDTLSNLKKYRWIFFYLRFWERDLMILVIGLTSPATKKILIRGTYVFLNFQNVDRFVAYFVAYFLN